MRLPVQLLIITVVVALQGTAEGQLFRRAYRAPTSSCPSCCQSNATAQATIPQSTATQPTYAQPTMAQPTYAQPVVAQPTIAQDTNMSVAYPSSSVGAYGEVINGQIVGQPAFEPTSSVIYPVNESVISTTGTTTPAVVDSASVITGQANDSSLIGNLSAVQPSAETSTAAPAAETGIVQPVSANEPAPSNAPRRSVIEAGSSTN